MEQTGIDQVIRLNFFLKLQDRVPLLMGGTLLFLSTLTCALAEVQIHTLASDLFAEGNFSGCITECARVLGVDPANESALFLKAVSELRNGGKSTTALIILADSTATSPEVSCKARYELARAFWKAGNNTEAISQFRKVFVSAGEGALFIRASCSICMIIEAHRELVDSVNDIMGQLDASSSLWTRKILDECRPTPDTPAMSITGKPAQWIISFYRRQISPAIGQRCSLVPSCSEYGMQSLKKHGLLGVAMTGDRMIREPDVVAEKPAPVRIGNKWYYTDTVSEHDWWIMAKPESEINRR